MSASPNRPFRPDILNLRTHHPSAVVQNEQLIVEHLFRASLNTVKFRDPDALDMLRDAVTAYRDREHDTVRFKKQLRALTETAQKLHKQFGLETMF